MPAPSNTLLTDDIILKTALMEFENNLVLAKTARRDYEAKFNPTTGRTIRIRKPVRYVGRVGRVAQPQAIDQQYTDIEVSDMLGVDMEVTSEQFALELDDFNRDCIKPAMVTLANLADMGLYDTTVAFSNFAGVAGSPPTSYAAISECNAVLNRFGIPRKDRFMLLKTDDANAAQSALYNTFNEAFNKQIILDGSMGNIASFDFYDVQNPIRPSRGSSSLGTPAVNGAGQSGLTLLVDGITPTTAQIKKGALFTIAGVNSVNPTSRRDTGKLAQFVVTQDFTAVAGAGTLYINVNDEGIILSGPYQNVTTLPADNALITFQATHTKNIFYHREAFAMVSIKLPESKGAVFQKNMINPKSKTSIRMTRQYDVVDDKEIIRFDFLPAFKCFPQYGGVLMGT